MLFVLYCLLSAKKKSLKKHDYVPITVVHKIYSVEIFSLQICKFDHFTIFLSYNSNLNTLTLLQKTLYYVQILVQNMLRMACSIFLAVKPSCHNLYYSMISILNSGKSL